MAEPARSLTPPGSVSFPGLFTLQSVWYRGLAQRVLAWCLSPLLSPVTLAQPSLPSKGGQAPVEYPGASPRFEGETTTKPPYRVSFVLPTRPRKSERSMYDLAILGAGAAGLMAAIRAAELGKSVILLEKNRRAGVKILMSGGTRCNLTNARGLRNLKVISGPIDPAYDPRQAQGARSIQAAFGPQGGPFLAPALKAFSVENSVAFFEAEGVATKVEGNGKVFPASDRATDVLGALLGRLERSGARLQINSPVTAIDPTDEGFSVTTPDQVISACKVIVAVGGLSFPGSGTTGDGYQLARRLGHTIVDPKPALVPIRVAPSWVTDLKGLTMPDIIARVLSPEGTGPVWAERRESLLFAHFGLTGPSILDVSRAVARHEGSGMPLLSVDWVPDLRPEEIEAKLQAEARNGRRAVANMVPEVVPRRLADALVMESGIPADRIGPELSRDERKKLVANLKGLRLPITGTLGFAKAEVTSGGVALDEVNPTTLESRRQPGLYFIGEVLDLDGLIGGYNFQAAWSLGWLAGTTTSISTEGRTAIDRAIPDVSSQANIQGS